MCLKKRVVGFLKRSITFFFACFVLVYSGLSSVKVSALSTLTFDLYNCTYEVTQGQPFEFQVYPDVYTPEWSFVNDTTLRFPLAQYAAARWQNPWILHISDSSVQFSSDQTYNFSFWIDLYGYPFTEAGLGREWSDFAPETLKVTVGGQIFTSRVYAHQGSTPEWKRLTYAVPVEIRNYSGSLDMFVEFAFADHSTEILDEATPNIQIAMSRKLEMTVFSATDQIIEQFGSDYTPPDTSDKEQYDQALEDSKDYVESALSGFQDNWKGVDAVLVDFQGAFLGFSAFFNDLVKSTFFDPLLMLSVCLGVVALLLGAAQLVVNRRR